MQKKKTTNKKRERIISALLVLAILVTTAFAFLSATDSKTNVFTIGKVDIQLQENFDTDLSGQIEDDEKFSDESQIQMEDVIAPGQSVLKQPYVVNTGKNNAWVYVTVGIPTYSVADIYRDENGDVAIAGSELKIKVQAYAIQENYDNVTESSLIWSKYFNNERKVAAFGNEETNTSVLAKRDKVFEFYNNDNDAHKVNDKWIFDGNVYHSQDNYDYYVFRYNDLLTHGETTNPVFDKVTLTDLIGEEAPPEPITLDYYIEEKIADTQAAYANLEAKDEIPDGYVLLKTEYYSVGDVVNELYFDDSLAQDGCTFDWKDASTQKAAFSGMVLETDTDLIADYDSVVDSSEIVADPGIVRYSVIVYNGELALRTYDTYSANSESYRDTTLVLPSELTFTTASRPTSSTGQLLSTVATDGSIIMYHMENIYNANITWQDGLTNGQYGDLATSSTNDNAYVPLEPNTTYTLTLRATGHEVTNVPIKKLVISDTVKRLLTKKGNTEKNMPSNLAEVYLPYGLKNFSTAVFANSSLTTLALPNTLETIGDSAFTNTYVESLVIPPSVNYLGIYALSQNGSRGSACSKYLDIQGNLTISNLKIPNGIMTLKLNSCNTDESLGRKKLLSRNYANSYKGIWCASTSLQSIEISGNVDLITLDCANTGGISFTGNGAIGLLNETNSIDIDIECSVKELFGNNISDEYTCKITNKVEKIFDKSTATASHPCNYLYNGDVNEILSHFYKYTELPEYSESESLVPCYVDPTTTQFSWDMCKINGNWYRSGFGCE